MELPLSSIRALVLDKLGPLADSPVQTGFPEDSDSDFVYRKFSEIFHHRRPQFTVFASNHALKASILASQAVLGVDTEEIGKSESGFRDLGWYEERKLQGEGGEAVEIASELICKMIYGFVGDGEAEFGNWLCEDGHNVGVFSVLETAGGVASPGPSGSLQCDLYRPFRLPAILVGDGRLGGISSTISAYESLKLRGYDVVAVVFEDHGLVNEVPLLSYLRNRVPVLVLPPIPQDMSDKLMEWFDEAQCAFSSLKEIMISDFIERTERLRDMPKKARDIIWWPFTQHKLVPEETVTVIDSRCGEHFAVHKVLNHDFIMQQFDACASWWTQGPDHTLQDNVTAEEHWDRSILDILEGCSVSFNSLGMAVYAFEGTEMILPLELDMKQSTFGNISDLCKINRWFQIELARDMGYAAARFGHVMFPENIHEPALECAELLLGGVGKGWASRVFFSDNGSTSIEIALKMAFRKFLFDNGILLGLPKADTTERCIDLKVLALRGSYHGDTLGAMEAQAPSSYTGYLQQPWLGNFL
ncbi:adenosylmethionine-8-amino-7-oxononanoate transaminase [Actinidia rufa]|uniref:Adenosylmethionine-8-amino-7-oxononanoate transaminase n=1 Tax=Actinidia rufa TaxID=165716 RepID=A0A7J0DSF4_9ERIC|nr:adenosylmethionine-8-amino-7-oxononanoate transaminase [Actinidia rufa]